MRRVIAAAVAVLGVLALTQSSAVAATSVEHGVQTGTHAIADWATEPTNPALGVTYSYTTLLLGNERSAGSASSTQVVLERFSYMYDADGNFVPLSDAIGLVDTPVTITNDLMSASAAGQVDLYYVDANGNTIGKAGTENFSAVFTGYGPLIRGQDVTGIDPDFLGAVVTPAISVQRYVNFGRYATISVTFSGLFGTADLGTQGFVGIARLHLLGITLTRG